MRIAIGSLGETINHLHDAFGEKYIDENEYLDVRALGHRALKAAIGWHDYLDNCSDKPPKDRRLKQPKRKRSDDKPCADNAEPDGY